MDKVMMFIAGEAASLRTLLSPAPAAVISRLIEFLSALFSTEIKTDTDDIFLSLPHPHQCRSPTLDARECLVLTGTKPSREGFPLMLLPLFTLIREGKGQLLYHKNTHSLVCCDLRWSLFSHLFKKKNKTKNRPFEY